MLTVGIRFGTDNSETTYIHQASDVATLITATASHVSRTAPLAVATWDQYSEQVALAVQHAATASLPFAVPALAESWYLSVPQVTVFPPHRVVSASQQVASQPDAAPGHLVVSVTLVFFFFPAEHVTELQVALAVQHAATASLPFAVPALVGSWYLSSPQVTVFPPHRVLSDSQQVTSQPDAAP